MKQLLNLSVVVIALSSCIPNPPPHIDSDVHLGVKMAYGSYVNAAVGTYDGLYIRPFISSNSDYGFSTTYSTRNRLLINEAWSFGKQLHYKKGVIRTRRCRDGACPAIESGMVLLDESQFNSAAVNGLEFELIGRLGNVTGRIPAQAFSQVLGLQGKLGLPTADSPVISAPARGPVEGSSVGPESVL